MRGFIRTATFECAFCRFSSPVTVRAEMGGVQAALAATRCPHCRRRSARPVFEAVVAGFVVELGLFVNLLQAPPLWGRWVFAVALAAVVVVVTVAFAQAWQRRGQVVFARTELPRAIAVRRRVKA